MDATYLSEEKSLCRYGVMFFINACCVYEVSKRLPEIALSSTEAEYVALSLGAAEGKYLRMVLEAMNEPQYGPMLIGQDNKSCIQIAENPGRHHGRTKHIDVRIRWIEREVLRAQLVLVYVKTLLMVADILTKALSYEYFARHASAMKAVQMPVKEKQQKRGKRKAESGGPTDMDM